MLGVLAKVYVNTGTYSSPTWDVFPGISDWSVNASWDEAEANSRASRVKRVEKTLIGLEVTGKVKTELMTNTDYERVIGALHSDDPLDVMILNGPKDTNGVRGYRFDAHVMSGNQDQGLGAVLYDDVTLKPAASANSPSTVVVSSGAPVFTAI